MRQAHLTNDPGWQQEFYKRDDGTIEGQGPREIQGAQVGSQVSPRGSLSSIRRIQALNAHTSFSAPTGYPPDRPAVRPGQYNQNWAGLNSSDRWQEFMYPNEYRRLFLDHQTQNVMLARAQIFRQAPRPIAIQQYALQTKAAAAGNYVAVVPRSGI